MSHLDGALWNKKTGARASDKECVCVGAVNLDTNVDRFLASSTSGIHSHSHIRNVKRNTRNTLIRFAYWISIGQNNKFACHTANAPLPLTFSPSTYLISSDRFFLFKWSVCLTTRYHKLMPKIESWTIYKMRTICGRTTTIAMKACYDGTIHKFVCGHYAGTECVWGGVWVSVKTVRLNAVQYGNRKREPGKTEQKNALSIQQYSTLYFDPFVHAVKLKL